MASIEGYEQVLAAAAACEDKKAEDIRILALDPAESGLSDYFLICNGTNERQNVAITDEIELRLKREFGVYPRSVEGRRQGEWILMDYVDFIVHVFSAEKRAFYGLERLRKSAKTISVDELNSELKALVSETRAKAPAKKAAVKAPAAKAAKPAVKTVAAKSVAAKAPAKATSKTPAKVVAAKSAKVATATTKTVTGKVAAKAPAKKVAAKVVAATKAAVGKAVKVVAKKAAVKKVPAKAVKKSARAK